jgi:sulfatase maturation enzyme AslB (radical SAM superfamily)
MLNSREIKVLHVEPTDVCQAACPMCARETDLLFDKTVHRHLNMEQITRVFDKEKISKLDKMFMCGVYGDPAAGTNTLDIYKQFRELNDDIVLGMNTNGALKDHTWWHELGSIFNQPQDYVVFSIDGLEDTNSVYRVNVNWKKLMTNVDAFISAGGSAHWDMLIYRHNEHQVDACEQLARHMGFSWFRAKVSKRGFNANIQQPIGWAVPVAHSTEIKCHALDEQSAYIDARGRFIPCCWFGARQHDVIDFDQIKNSWTSPQPNKVCAKSCGSSNGVNNFISQWRKEVNLNV